MTEILTTHQAITMTRDEERAVLTDMNSIKPRINVLTLPQPGETGLIRVEFEGQTYDVKHFRQWTGSIQSASTDTLRAQEGAAWHLALLRAGMIPAEYPA